MTAKVWRSLIPAASWPKWEWGLRGLALWWEAREDQSRLCLEDHDYIHWVYDVFDSGASMSKVRCALYGIDAWLHANAHNGIAKTEWMSAILRSYERKWKNRDSRKDRKPMGETFADITARRPPKGADPTLWAAFVWITWVFALRQAETKGVQPKDLSYDPVHKRWTCTVRFPKVNEYKKVQDIS